MSLPALGAFNSVLGQTLAARQRQQTVMRVALLTAAFNVAANLVLLPTVGIVGAAVAVAASEVLTAVSFSVADRGIAAAAAREFAPSLLHAAVAAGAVLAARALWSTPLGVNVAIGAVVYVALAVTLPSEGARRITEALRMLRRRSSPPLDSVAKAVVERPRRPPADVVAQARDVGDEQRRLVGRGLERAELDEVGTAHDRCDPLHDVGDRDALSRADVHRALDLGVEQRRERVAHVGDVQEVAHLASVRRPRGQAGEERPRDGGDEPPLVLVRSVEEEDAAPRKREAQLFRRRAQCVLRLAVRGARRERRRLLGQKTAPAPVVLGAGAGNGRTRAARRRECLEQLHARGEPPFVLRRLPERARLGVPGEVQEGASAATPR